MKLVRFSPYGRWPGWLLLALCAATILPKAVAASPALSITNPTSLPTAVEGTAYGPLTFAAAGGTGAYLWSATGLPNGLSMSPGGTLGGTPATGSHGGCTVQVTVLDSVGAGGEATLPLTVQAAQPLQIAGPASLPAGTENLAYGPVTFTATGGTYANGYYRVPKRDLIVGLQLLLQRRGLQIAKGLKFGPVLAREMAEMRVKITPSGNEQYGAWREGEHDDLVLAVALACWGVRKAWPGGGDGEEGWWRGAG